MKVDKMQTSRFELKYRIEEETALKIRDFVNCHLEMDENGVGKPDFSYPVHSVYFDSDEMKTYWDTINGTKNRFKLRIRFYDDNPANPVYFEIKRRMNNCIMKQRGGVKREAVPLLLAGHFPEPEHMASKADKHLYAVQNFCQLMQTLNASSKVHVAYLREAYVPSDDNSARLTMDRVVRTELDLKPRLQTKTFDPIRIWGKIVVLELKFTNRFPRWFGDLVRVFNLNQCGAAKYADGVTLLMEQRPDLWRLLQTRPNGHDSALAEWQSKRTRPRRYRVGEPDLASDLAD